MSSNVHPEGEPSEDFHGVHPDAVPAWLGNLLDLLQSRIDLIEIETKQIIADGLVRILMLVAAVFMMVVTWFLLMAAIAGLAHAYLGFAWYWGCLAIGGIHILAILAMIRRARAARPPAFQHTRSEFKKDREWLLNLQHRKSKH